jgi:hypothetical protein
MKTAAQYQHQISVVDLDAIKLDGISAQDAKEALARIESIHNELLEIERNLNLDLHALNAQFQGRLAAELHGMANRRGRNRAEDEQRIRDEQAARLAPYEQVKSRLNELLARLQEMRTRLESIQT